MLARFCGLPDPRRRGAGVAASAAAAGVISEIGLTLLARKVARNTSRNWIFRPRNSISQPSMILCRSRVGLLRHWYCAVQQYGGGKTAGHGRIGYMPALRASFGQAQLRIETHRG